MVAVRFSENRNVTRSFRKKKKTNNKHTTFKKKQNAIIKITQPAQHNASKLMLLGIPLIKS